MKFRIIYLWQSLKHWCWLNCTKAGRLEKFFSKGVKNADEYLSKRKADAKTDMLVTAGTLIEEKKIIHFDGKKSLTKSKTTNHKLKTVVEKKHDKQLKENRLKIKKNSLEIADA